MFLQYFLEMNKYHSLFVIISIFSLNYFCYHASKRSRSLTGLVLFGYLLLMNLFYDSREEEVNIYVFV